MILAAFPDLDHLADGGADIGDDGQVDADGLVDRAAVDIDMDLDAVGRKGIEAARDPVIEARAEAQHDVALVHRHIGFVRAVHAQHTEPCLARSRVGAKAHQRRRYRRSAQVRPVRARRRWRRGRN